MVCGMTYEEFWNGDPSLAVVYRRKRVLEDKRFNEQAWLQGEYTYVAVATALQNAFRKKGTEAVQYLKEPFKVGEDTETEKERKRKKAFDDSIAFIEKMRGAKNGRSNN